MKVRLTVLAAIAGLVALPWLAAAQPAPSITLTKTVGTTPGVCAVTDAVTVTAGTEVYYCFLATNTGATTFEFHDLVDSELGTILDDLPYSLAPGASSPQVIVPETPTATVTNTATWTAVTALAGYTANTAATYSYIPINTTGTLLPMPGDDDEANITLPFAFTFYGVTSSNLRVGNNGGILFNATTGDLSFSNGALPRATPAYAILPFWDDMDNDTGGVYWEVQGTAPNRVAIVEWYNLPHFSNVGSATFQVLLYETTNEIRFQYADVDFGNATYNNGASATVGINRNATAALQVSNNQAVITNGQAILISPTVPLSASATDSATVTVQRPEIDVAPASLLGYQAPNQVATTTLTIGNVGEAPLDWQVDETLPRAPAAPAGPPVITTSKQYPVVTSAEECKLYEVYAGREPEGWAEHCASEAPQVWGASPESPTSTGYVQDVRNDRFAVFTLNDFPGQTTLGNPVDALYGIDFDSAATTLWALNDATDTLGTIDLATGAYTPVVACPPGGGAANWTGLTIDPVSGVFWASTSTSLFTIDPATGASTLVGPFGVAGGIMIDIAVNALGEMYGHDIATDSIYSIDTATGAATLIGATGFAANFAQGLDFDNEDGTLYIFLYVGSGVNHYGTVNLATGAVTPLASTNPSGEYEGATQTLGICIPSDAAWLSVSPASGTTAPAATSPVTVTFDSTGLALGTYEAQLCVLSNDPDGGSGNGTRMVPVPVTLEVSETPLSVSVVKTVGTDPAVCAPTSAITVDPGTTVYYCYTATNTGSVAYDLHTLVDDQLGTIFSGLNYVLAPGASIDTVTAGLTVSAVIDTTTTNVATWSASVTGGPTVEGTASATVTVLGSVLEIPTLSPAGLAGLVTLLALAAFWMFRARRRAA